MKDSIKVWDGKPITKSGVYSGIPLTDYHSQQICDGPSVSSTNLRRILEENGGSPAHMWSEWTKNPSCVEPAEKKAWTFGRACHHLLLGQPDFRKEFVIQPEQVRDHHGILVAWQGNKTICREWKAQAAAGGARWDADLFEWIEDLNQQPLTVLTQDEAEHIIGIAKKLQETPVIYDQRTNYGLLNGHIECSFFWRDKRTGIWLKARPDAVPTDSGMFTDLKTTTSVQWLDLIRTVSNLAYHQQAALIADGAQICAGLKMEQFVLVFCEKKPPYCVRAVVIREEAIQLGHRQNRRALDIVAHCLEANRWPGPGEDDVMYIDLQDRYIESAKLNCETFEQEKAA